MRRTYRDGIEMARLSLNELVDMTKSNRKPCGTSYVLGGVFITEQEVDTDRIAFKSIPMADDIIGWAERHGIDDRLDDMLTMNTVMDIPCLGVRVIWSITLPDEDTLMLFRLGLDLNDRGGKR
jgi:hypothetical protein